MNQLEIYMQHPFIMQRIKEERKKQGFDESLEPYLDEDGDVMFGDSEDLFGFHWGISCENENVWDDISYNNFSSFYKFHNLEEPKQST